MQDLSPSTTAYKVALNVITLGSEPSVNKVLPDGIVQATEKLLLAAEVIPESWIRWARQSWMPSLYKSLDWILPGTFIGLAYRKAFYEKQIRTAIASGASQVLMLGAGYDTLGWRLALEFPQVRFYEIDHPATAHYKHRGIQKIGKRDNLHLVQADLSRIGLDDVIDAVKLWRRREKTVISAEGLLMYLPKHAVRELFMHCNAVTGSHSRIVFDYLNARSDGRIDAGLWSETFQLMIMLMGEPWQWGIEPEDLRGFLMDLGWEHQPDISEQSEKCGIEFLGVATK